MAPERPLDPVPSSLRILAIDCATPLASAALLHGVRIVAEREAAGGQHAETLLGLVDGVLEESGVRIEDVDAFAVSKGPGAFTSLRVGLATIKGLAFGTERPVAGISTLEALAWEVTEQIQTELPVAVLLDARREQCYAGAYERRGDGLNTVFAAGVYPASELNSQLPKSCYVVGSGADLYAEVLAPHTDDFSGRVWVAGRSPHARAVGVLGSHALARGEGVSAGRLEPDYLRGADARLPGGAAVPEPGRA